MRVQLPSGRSVNLISAPSFIDTLPGLVAIDELHEQRVSAVLQRIRAVAAMQCPSAG
jgi:hypothetical protein